MSYQIYTPGIFVLMDDDSKPFGMKTCDNCFEAMPLRKRTHGRDFFCLECWNDAKEYKKEKQQLNREGKVRTNGKE